MPARRPVLFWSSLAAFFWVLWLGANLPALTEAWWYQDDFWMMEQPAHRIYELAHSAGRPVTALLFVLHKLWRTPDDYAGALLVRLLQGLMHAGVATAFVAVVSRQVPRTWAILSVLPFLLWAFNGEAVLWFGGIQHVAGGGLAISGLGLILAGVARERWWVAALGSALCGSSILANQAPTGAAIFLWLVTLAWRGMDGAFPRQVVPSVGGGFFTGVGQTLDRWVGGRNPRSILVEGLFLGCGLVAGAAVSLAMMLRWSYHRTAAPINWESKLQFWMELNEKLFFWPGFYPLATQVMVGALLLALGLTMFLAVAKRRMGGGALLGMGAILLSGSALFFLANLIIAMNWASFRIFYTAPLYFGVIALTAARLSPGPSLRWVPLGLCAGLGLTFAHLSWIHAGHYPAQYRSDLAVLRQAEEEARAMGATRVLTMPWPHAADTVNWNPYGHRFSHLDAHRSEFNTDWSGHPFIRLHSSLLTPEPESRRPEFAPLSRAVPAGPPWYAFPQAPGEPDLILIVPR